MRSIMLAACAAAFVVPAANAQTVYDQGPGDIVGFGFYSSSHPRPNRNFKHADDFTLAQSADISTITWRGMSEGRVRLDLNNFSSYTIEFYTSIAGGGGFIPGTLLKTETFTKAQTIPTLTGRTAFDTGAFEYAQQATLSSPFTALAGQKYFLAISAAAIVTNADAWMWQDGQFVNGQSGLLSYATGQWTNFNDTDSCFSLIAVPSPGAAGVFSLGALVALRRRR